MSTVFLVADHPVFRAYALRYLREQTRRDLTVLGAAAWSPELLDQLSANPPELLLLMLGLDRCQGVERVKLLRARLPQTRIMVMADPDADDYQLLINQAGADALIPLNRLPTDLIDAIFAMMKTEP